MSSSIFSISVFWSFLIYDILDSPLYEFQQGDMQYLLQLWLILSSYPVWGKKLKIMQMREMWNVFHISHFK